MALRSNALISLLAKRRSYYALTASSPIPDSEIRSILSNVLLTVPSAFNVQSTRMVVCLNEEHRRLWDVVKDTMRVKLGEDKYPQTETKLNGFRGGYGTVLFYEDEKDVQKMKEKFSTYKDQFEGWTDHTSGMHQLSVWVALEAEGFGANLQHYNPLIDATVAEAFRVPDTWVLKSQMVFGSPESGTPAAKEKKPVDQRLYVFGQSSKS